MVRPSTWGTTLMMASTMGTLRGAIMSPFHLVGAIVALGPAGAVIASVNIVVFLLLLANAPPEGLTTGYLSSWGGNYPELTKEGQVWRLATYGFIHGSWLHLILNVLPLVVIGAMLSAEFGTRRFVILHFSGVVAGGAALVALGGHDIVSVGSSGGIFALAGALTALVIRKHPRVSKRVLMVDLPMMAATSLIPGVDWRTHLGGFVVGLILTLIWTRGDWKPVVKW